ncbi:MAG TPA: DedA family protein [Cyclobacteriaceae bacterium]|nr:DedA family protein [Cyclobacteriaceae bacterium]
MEEFFAAYGYIALLAGTFLEGETALLLASILTHKGLFFLPYVMLVAWLGGWLSDLIYFFLGRNKGADYLLERPALSARAQQLRNFVMEHRLLILFSYRFLYGFRVVLPLLIGMSKIPTRQFIFSSMLAGCIWAMLVGSSGYLLGQWLDARFDIDEHAGWIVAACAGFGLSLGFTIKTLFQKKIKQVEG